MQHSSSGTRSLITIMLIGLGSAIVAAILTSAALVIIDRLDRPGIEIEVAERPPITIQIGGAVATPGTYDLPADARLQDAIAAAGGLTSDADHSLLNLAARIGDGEVITVPAFGQHAEPSPAATSAELEIVNINTASLEELDTLPGIGPVIGERIIAYRDEHGPFKTVEELTEVEGISDRLLERLRPRITVGD